MPEAQPRHCPAWPKLAWEGRVTEEPIPSKPHTLWIHATSATKTLLLLLEEEGRPQRKEGRQGGSYWKFKEIRRPLSKEKPPCLQLGVRETETQSCSITSLARPRGQGP